MKLPSLFAATILAITTVAIPRYASHAVTFSITPEKPSVTQYQETYLDVSVDPEGTSINALEGSLRIQGVSFQIEQLMTGESIISLWVQPPTQETDATGGTRIIFSGIIPGGFDGVYEPLSNKKIGGALFRIRLTPLTSGILTLMPDNLTALANDGEGSVIPIGSTSLNLTVNEGTETITLPRNDYTKPEAFELTLTRDPNLFDNRWFIAFHAEDRESGIDHYELLETKVPDPMRPGYRVVESPALLTDQSLTSYLYVKAIDKEGNERYAELAPTFTAEPRRWFNNTALWGILGSVLALVLIVSYFMRRAYQKQTKT